MATIVALTVALRSLHNMVQSLPTQACEGRLRWCFVNTTRSSSCECTDTVWLFAVFADTEFLASISPEMKLGRALLTCACAALVCVAKSNGQEVFGHTGLAFAVPSVVCAQFGTSQLCMANPCTESCPTCAECEVRLFTFLPSKGVRARALRLNCEGRQNMLHVSF